jgi:hypothetical protein
VYWHSGGSATNGAHLAFETPTVWQEICLVDPRPRIKLRTNSSNAQITAYEAESVTRVVGRSEVCCSSKPSRMTIESRKVPGTTNPKKPMLPAEV